MKTLVDYQQAGQELYHKLHLSTYPIAIKYIKDVSEIPEGVTRPSARGQKWSLCQAFTYARRWGWSVAMTSDDNFCTPATASHGWEDISFEDHFQSQILQLWHKDVESERKIAEHGRNRLSTDEREKGGEYIGSISSPLSQTVVIPDSVLVYGNAQEITHIIHALTYEGENIPVSSFTGFGEPCIKGGLIPFITQKPQIVIPGTGDRAFSGVYDYEIAIGFPATLLFYVVENLLVAGGPRNMGQPLKTLLATGITEKLTPGFRFLREKIDEIKAKKGQ